MEYNIPTSKGTYPPPFISQDESDNEYSPPINPLHTTAYNDGPGPACISQEALYSVLGDAMLNATHHFVPAHMENKPLAINAPLDIAPRQQQRTQRQNNAESISTKKLTHLLRLQTDWDKN